MQWSTGRRLRSVGGSNLCTGRRWSGWSQQAAWIAPLAAQHLTASVHGTMKMSAAYLSGKICRKPVRHVSFMSRYM